MNRAMFWLLVGVFVVLIAMNYLRGDLNPFGGLWAMRLNYLTS